MSHEPEPLPASHVVDCPYPGWNDAQVAGMTIIRHLTGAEKQELPCLAHCGWVAQGFAQSVALPHDGHRPPVGKGKKLNVPTTPKGRAKILEQAFGEGTAQPTAATAESAEAVPWGLVLMIVKALLDQWLKKGKP